MYNHIELEDESYAEDLAESFADELGLEQGMIDSSAYFDDSSYLSLVVSGTFLNSVANHPVIKAEGSSVLVKKPYDKMEDLESAVETVDGIEFEDIDNRLSENYAEPGLERSNV